MFGKNNQAGNAAAGAAGNPARKSRVQIRNSKRKTRYKFRSQVFDIVDGFIKRPRSRRVRLWRIARGVLAVRRSPPVADEMKRNPPQAEDWP
jgi:hypothetical protein